MYEDEDRAGAFQVRTGEPPHTDGNKALWLNCTCLKCPLGSAIPCLVCPLPCSRMFIYQITVNQTAGNVVRGVERHEDERTRTGKGMLLGSKHESADLFV